MEDVHCKRNAFPRSYSWKGAQAFSALSLEAGDEQEALLYLDLDSEISGRRLSISCFSPVSAERGRETHYLVCVQNALSWWQHLCIQPCLLWVLPWRISRVQTFIHQRHAGLWCVSAENLVRALSCLFMLKTLNNFYFLIKYRLFIQCIFLRPLTI